MARGIWKGTLGFGLVSIGVELFTAEAPSDLDFTMLDRRDHSPIGYRKYNKRTGTELDTSDIAKGYAIDNGRYVILSAEDFKSANPRATGMIDILGFVRNGDIELAYFDKPYVVGPLKGSEKAYALFVKALEATARIGVAQIVIRTKQHVAAVYPHRHGLMVQLMRYASELRQPADFGIQEDADTRKALRPLELKMAEQLVESMSTEWTPTEFRDTYRDDLLQLIQSRAAQPGGKGSVASPDNDAPPPRVLDLMAALKGSLAAQARGRRVARPTGLRVAQATTAKTATTPSSAKRKTAVKRRSARKSA